MPINITDVAQCFQNCTSLTNIPDNFELPPNVIYMQYMFANTSINTPNKFILPSTTLNIIHLFDGCKNLVSTPPHMFDNNPSVNSYDYLFNNCTLLTMIDNTFKYVNSVQSSGYTFANCKIKTIPETLILPETLTNLEYCFYKNSTLTTIHKNFKFPAILNNLRYCFSGCTALTEIPNTIWPESSFKIETIINMQRAFENCKNATGTIPQYKLWKGEIYWYPLSETGTLNPMTFTGCTKLDNYKYIPKHWGGLGETDNRFDIGIETTEKNEVFALPIHRTYDTYDYGTGERLTKIANYNFKVDWGDGSELSTVNISGNNTTYWDMTSGTYYGYPKNFPTSTNKTAIPDISGISHTYTNPGKYNISIIAQLENTITNYQCDTFYTHINDTHTWRHLYSLFSLGDLKWKSFGNSFCNAINLNKIPNEDIISTTTDTLIFNVSYMFYNCQSISNIPINFKLHKNLIDMSYMFYNCFKACITTTGFKPGMMPDNGFYNSTTAINVTSMFENCKAMTGQTRGRLLWFSPYNTWISTNCYTGCKKLQNWDYIPLNWGGGGKEEPFIFQIKLPKRSDNKYQVTLPIVNQLKHWWSKRYYFPTYIYNFRIDWGDGSSLSTIKNWQSPEKTHIYTKYGENGTDGIFTIKIYGLFEGWDTYNTPPMDGDCNAFKDLIYKILNWGEVDILYTAQFCSGCSNLIEIPNTLLPIPLANHNQSGIGKINSYNWNYMFFRCNHKDFQVNDNVNLPIDETLLNFDSINRIETVEMFLATNINYIPKMFN